MFDNTILWEFLRILAILSIDRGSVREGNLKQLETQPNIMQWHGRL